MSEIQKTTAVVEWATPLPGDDPSDAVWFDEAGARRFAESRGTPLLMRTVYHSEWVEVER
jgi:hypothetical protein